MFFQSPSSRATLIILQVMLRNIPNKVNQAELKEIIDQSSFGKYDFMYLRIDFSNDCKYVTSFWPSLR